MSLPSESELLGLQQDLLNGAKSTIQITVNPEAARAAVGLTELEAETAFAKCLVEHASFKIEAINDIKAQMIKKSGLMQKSRVWHTAERH